MKYVLFVCNHNAGRSQMAQAFFERLAPADVRAESAGSRPARTVWPEVVEVMAEVGLDLSRRKPKKLLREHQLHADWAVTMGCADTCPYVPTTVEDWDVPDPAGRPLEEVRTIRDAIELRVRDLVEHRLDAIRTDRTAISSAWRSCFRSSTSSSPVCAVPRRSGHALTWCSRGSATRACARTSSASRIARRVSV